jgi:CheY-like chemotaxis protein
MNAQQPCRDGAFVGTQRRTAAKRILLVDDDLHVAETLSELLGLEGYLVTVAHDAAAALAGLGHEVPDLVLCDLTLPGTLDGFGFAHACRADPRFRDLHLIAVSGYDGPADRRRAVAAGFDTLVGKPVDLARIHDAIENGR